MESSSAEIKCVMIFQEDLPHGLALNIAAVLGLTLGRRIETIVGPDVVDGSGTTHAGITTLPIPVLRAPAAIVREIRLSAVDLDPLLAVDFTDAAASTTTYGAYTETIERVPTTELQYLGVALCGAKKHVNRLSGSLPLMR